MTERWIPLSAYEYLAFLLPGGALTLIALAVYGTPMTEPGVASFAVLLGVAFVVGHAVAAIASSLQPMLWGHGPRTATDPLWGVRRHQARGDTGHV